jgi:hypothetical protein
MAVTAPHIPSAKLWKTRQAKCLAVIEAALQLLGKTTSLPTAEVDLNRTLYFCLLQAHRQLFPDDEIAPLSECNNQPDPDDQARAIREQKRPDFQWIYLDRYEADPSRSSRAFVLECKRLGTPPRADWPLNINYLQHGIHRFRHEDWAYAKQAECGAMVGYVQSMDLVAILSAVNAECGGDGLPNLNLAASWMEGGTSKLDHSFERPFPVSPLTLYHFWVDLRP